ncbi:PDR/VanB family oxidoreductase [Streptomyces iconiensis]|uniref:PDR/VanB family oxidoreductase n=1 Tax=Streptomyces iconiensis TaxID=1384038 RepID=A0ABT7A2V4_9ACTN|nr:PDR/VanB family oxidoreductase [Streptomyces iconiensis]MDJ1135668.1 PDR/VanB family oxidoreductase [Streptomyces iconiensis]
MTSAAPARPTTAAADHLAVVVRQLRWEADGVLSVEFCAADGGDLPPWRPGAHIELALPTGITRQYSLCGSPEDRSRYRIGVLRERVGRGGSEYVHMFLRPGQPLRLRGPRDNFGFDRARSYLFIAGGVGITPILPMVHQAEAWGVPWQLVYGGRRAASMAFRDELRPYGDRVQLYPEDAVGRIPLARWLDREQEGTDIYACGPEPLLTAVESAGAHWRPGALHLERFKARKKPAQQNSPVEVVCAQSDRTVTVPSDTSVLSALEGAGIPVAGSCREGVCGTCETRVLDGEPDHRDDILSEQDRATGDRMYVCVSRARGPRLVLDV